jgi:hypothetical protein
MTIDQELTLEKVMDCCFGMDSPFQYRLSITAQIKLGWLKKHRIQIACSEGKLQSLPLVLVVLCAHEGGKADFCLQS